MSLRLSLHFFELYSLVKLYCRKTWSVIFRTMIYYHASLRHDIGGCNTKLKRADLRFGVAVVNYTDILDT